MIESRVNEQWYLVRPQDVAAFDDMGGANASRNHRCYMLLAAEYGDSSPFSAKKIDFSHPITHRHSDMRCPSTVLADLSMHLLSSGTMEDFACKVRTHG